MNKSSESPDRTSPSSSRRLSPLGEAVVATLALTLCGAMSAAPLTLQPPETLPGFRAGDAVWMSGVDRVSLYSGDVGIRIPLGPTYPISPGFSYGMAATYSVKHWWMDDQAGSGCNPPVRYARVSNRDESQGGRWRILSIGPPDFMSP